MARSLIQEEVTMETKAENWKDHAQKAGSLAVVILGNILYALAVKLFLMPAGLLTGGTTGCLLYTSQVGDNESSEGGHEYHGNTADDTRKA